jgi:hypothetical protein
VARGAAEKVRADYLPVSSHGVQIHASITSWVPALWWYGEEPYFDAQKVVTVVDVLSPLHRVAPRHRQLHTGAHHFQR